ncbi:MAG: hypothetical protein ACC635_05730 [Acidiferrobacterales bacterium]
MDLLFLFWNGDKPLWQSFWLVHVFGVAVVLGGCWFYLRLLKRGLLEEENPLRYLLALLFALIIVYTAVVDWNSAANTDFWLWTWLSRVVNIFISLYASLIVAILLALPSAGGAR